MSTMEIILLVIGIVVFIASFVIPEKLSNIKEEDKQFGKEQIKEMLEKEMNGVKNRVEEVVDETITYAVEKTERSLERLSNEKILAVNEYSEVVLKDINKNHEEVMFLYDMLNDKQKNIKSTVHEVEQTAKAVKQSANEAKLTMESMNFSDFSGQTKASEIDTAHAADKNEFRPIVIERVAASATTKATPKNVKANSTKAKTATSSKKTKTSPLPDVDIQFITGNGQDKNNNERILELHKGGKSNMSIAKELSLGVGEVKLVIDLFEGM